MPAEEELAMHVNPLNGGSNYMHHTELHDRHITSLRAKGRTKTSFVATVSARFLEQSRDKRTSNDCPQYIGLVQQVNCTGKILRDN